VDKGKGLFPELNKTGPVPAGIGKGLDTAGINETAAGISVDNVGAEDSTGNDGNASVRIAKAKGEDKTAKGVVGNCLRTVC